MGGERKKHEGWKQAREISNGVTNQNCKRAELDELTGKPGRKAKLDGMEKKWRTREGGEEWRTANRQRLSRWR